MADGDRPESSIDDYLRLISHELKRPIHAIRALLDTVMEGYAGEVAEKTRFVIEKAVNRSIEAEQVITDLIRFQRYDSASGIDTRDEVPLAGLIRNLADRYGREASDRNIALRTEIPDDLEPIVEGDANALEHAFRNLVENAIKYTDTGGTVTITVGMSSANIVCVGIADSGAGISEEDQKRIFEPYFRAPSEASKKPGTGLGLPIVLKVIEGHGGQIELESTLGEGSVFSTMLPVARVERVETGPARRKIVIVGGVTAGPKTAARLRRLDEESEITIVEQNQFLSYSGCGLPSYIAGRVETATELMSSGDANIRDIRFFEAIDNIRILNNTRVDRIDRKRSVIETHDLTSGTSTELPYDVLVLATGARPVVPDIKGVETPGVFTLRSLEDATRIKRALARKHAADLYFVGGGLVGISTADELIRTGTRITILEKKQYILQKMFDRDFAKRIEDSLNRRGVQVRTETEVTSIRKNEDRFEIRTSRGVFTADFVVLSAGVEPNSELAAAAGLEIGSSGGIIVDSSLRTSDSHIYAVGDCVESNHSVTGAADYWPLGAVSTKMGRIAADNIAGRDSRFAGHVASAMYRLQDVSIARTGITSRIAFKHGYDFESVVVCGNDRAHYEPGSEMIALKVIADRKSGRILGAQGFGTGDVVSRIELFATAISHELDLASFFDLDLGYSPKFNTAIDIAQTATLVLKNKIDGLIKTIHPDKLGSLEDEPVALVSVCPTAMYPRHDIRGSINVPLERIRQDQLPYNKNRQIVLYSRTSSGAYTAYRYLTSKGYTNLRVLEGGFLFYLTEF